MDRSFARSRRGFLGLGASAAALSALGGFEGRASAQEPSKAAGLVRDPWAYLKMGIATYTFSRLSLDDAIKGGEAGRPPVCLDQGFAPAAQEHGGGAEGRRQEVQGRRDHGPELRRDHSRRRRSLDPQHVRVRPGRRHPDHRLQAGQGVDRDPRQVRQGVRPQGRDPQPRPGRQGLALALRRLGGDPVVRPEDRRLHRRRPHRALRGRPDRRDQEMRPSPARHAHQGHFRPVRLLEAGRAGPRGAQPQGHPPGVARHRL